MSISALGASKPVGEEVVIQPGSADGPLVSLAGKFVLVLAEDHVAFEIDLHRLPGIVDPGLAVGADRPVRPLLRIRPAPDHGLVGLDVDRARLGRSGHHVDTAAEDVGLDPVGRGRQFHDLQPPPAASEEAGCPKVTQERHHRRRRSRPAFDCTSPSTGPVRGSSGTDIEPSGAGSGWISGGRSSRLGVRLGTCTSVHL